MKNKPDIRKFEGRAIRDTSDGKIEWFGVTHPAVEMSFGKFMDNHRYMPNGDIRESDNWWDGWDKIVSLQSMLRHVKDLEMIEAGYIAFEIREAGKVYKHYVKSIDEANDCVKDWKEMKVNFHWITGEEAANSIKFNCNSYILKDLNEK